MTGKNEAIGRETARSWILIRHEPLHEERSCIACDAWRKTGLTTLPSTEKEKIR